MSAGRLGTDGATRASEPPADAGHRVVPRRSRGRSSEARRHQVCPGEVRGSGSCAVAFAPSPSAPRPPRPPPSPRSFSGSRMSPQLGCFPPAQTVPGLQFSRCYDFPAGDLQGAELRCPCPWPRRTAAWRAVPPGLWTAPAGSASLRGTWSRPCPCGPPHTHAPLRPASSPVAGPGVAVRPTPCAGATPETSPQIGLDPKLKRFFSARRGCEGGGTLPIGHVAGRGPAGRACEGG